jgi:multiple sugar transport system permease protein
MARSQTALPIGSVQARSGAVWRRRLGPDWSLGWLFMLPVAAILLGLVLYPFLSAVLLSVEDRLLGQTQVHWVFLANYNELLHNPLFLKAVINTVEYTAAAVAIKFVLGLISAAVLNQDIRGKNFWRGVLFLPWAIPAVVSAYAWRFVLDTNGLFNSLIVAFHLRDEYIYFISDEHLVLPSVILVTVWAGYPFYTMNFLAGMQAISHEMYEAAEIDGAGTLQRYFYITLPNLQYVILITVLLSTIWTSSNLAQILILTTGGPNYASTTLPLLAYLTAVPGLRLSLGASMSMMMVPAYLFLVIFLTRRMLKED